MKNTSSSFILSFLILVFCVSVMLKLQDHVMDAAEPLYTNSRWIVDEDGIRVKLACVNWPSHLEPVLAEGLNKSPVDTIVHNIAAGGFNCVRFTWPLDLATNDTLASTTVEDRFRSLGLNKCIEGIRAKNKDFLNYTLIDAYKKVVATLGDNNVSVILDNHITKAGWCCSKNDGNGFFGDRFFDPQQWLHGLRKMAIMFNQNKHVVGMSLRNELRGPNQNATFWYKYMQEGAETVHKANPDVLVILGGLSSDYDLSFLQENPVNISFTKKLVFEVHRYGFSKGGHLWKDGIPNQVCATFTDTFRSSAGFLLELGYPLFVSEFGGDQRGINPNDNRYLNCMFGVIADLDLDWALWTLQGSYYWRQGKKDMDEVYGVLNKNWSDFRNLTYMARVRSVQVPYLGPGLFDEVTPYNIIYHSKSGFCIVNSVVTNQLRLGFCQASDAWNYNPSKKTIMKNGTNSCIQAVGVGKPIILGTNCTGSTSRWDMISDSKLQLSSNLPSGNSVCMDIGKILLGSYIDAVVITTPCDCLVGDRICDPGSQWFKIIQSRRKPVGWPN